jgi:hypothetical protein
MDTRASHDQNRPFFNDIQQHRCVLFLIIRKWKTSPRRHSPEINRAPDRAEHNSGTVG